MLDKTKLQTNINDMETSIRFNSLTERRNFENGLRQVAARLKNHRKATAAEMAAYALAEGERLIRHKLATAAKPRTMAAPTPAKPPAPAPVTKSPARKNYTAPGIVTRKRFAVAGGLFA